MPKIAFSEKLRLSPANKARLEEINTIIEAYQDQGYVMTLRQLYYQLVARGVLPNSDKEYKKLGALLVKGRMAGVVDWDAIEDRGRTAHLPYWANNVSEALRHLSSYYRLDRMATQPVYLETWVEKQALEGVLKRVTEHYHVRLMVNKGYSSASAMYEAAKRFKEAWEDGKDCHILYLGDHDPSGLDMVRDIRQRLHDFGEEPEVSHIGLTMEQVLELDPPPNPAKITDSRSDWYISKYGDESWELDAIPPPRLVEIVEGAILELIDEDAFEERKEQETKDLLRLHEIAEEQDMEEDA